MEVMVRDYRALPIYQRCLYVIIGHLGMDLFRFIQMITYTCERKLLVFLLAIGVDERTVVRIYMFVDRSYLHQFHAMFCTICFLLYASAIVSYLGAMDRLSRGVSELSLAKVIGHFMLSEIYDVQLKYARDPCFLSFFMQAVMFAALIIVDFVPDMPILLAFMFVRHGIRK